MGVNQTVFPSKRERKHYEHLKDRWSDKYRLYSNLPFLTVLNVSDLKDWTDWTNPKPFEVSVEDFNRLKKTSIDFTLCDLSEKPIVCIEFDGIYQGTNVGDRYVAPFKNDPWRQQITDLKLRIAHGSLFPYFIMGSSQFQVIDANDKLAIVDCVIGAVLSSARVKERFNQGFDPSETGMTQEEFEALDHTEQQAVVEDWALGVEVEAEFEENPLFKIVYSLREKLGVRTMGYRYLDSPDLANVSDPAERARLLESTPLIGAQSWIELPTGQRITGTVWVPNFHTVGYSPFGFLDELATYVALKRAERRVESAERRRKRDKREM